MMIGTAENRAFYDIAMRYKNAEGNWVEVDEANFPTGGVEVVLPYPNGTDSKDTFTIVTCLRLLPVPVNWSSFRTRSRRMACTSV